MTAFSTCSAACAGNASSPDADCFEPDPMQRLCATPAIGIDLLHLGAHICGMCGAGRLSKGVTTMPKRITLVTSMILFTAITGQAYARPQHFGTQHSTHAMASQANTQDE